MTVVRGNMSTIVRSTNTRALAVKASASIRRARRPAPAVVLMYHRVAVSEQDPLALCVTPEHFADQVAALQEVADIVDPASIVAPGPRPRVAITFDDGYLDNLEHALPTLERHGVPACIFSTNQFGPDAPEFWWDQLDHLLLEGDVDTAVIEIEHPELRLRAQVGTEEDRVRVFRFLNRRFRSMTRRGREDVLDQLHALLHRTPQQCASHRRLDAAQLRTLADGGLVEIGGHTANHLSLRASCDEVVRDEILENRRVLTSVLGKAPRLFAYPYGDRDARSIVTARDAGYDYAFSTITRPVPALYRPHDLPRMFVGDWSGEDLVGRVHALLGS